MDRTIEYFKIFNKLQLDDIDIDLYYKLDSLAIIGTETSAVNNIIEKYPSVNNEHVSEFVKFVRRTYFGKPRFIHDCDGCIFLGSLYQYDLYFCPSSYPTIILRFGNDGPEYSSGLMFAQFDYINRMTHNKDNDDLLNRMFAYRHALCCCYERGLYSELDKIGR